jgi:hypothetical protein
MGNSPTKRAPNAEVKADVTLNSGAVEQPTSDTNDIDLIDTEVANIPLTKEMMGNSPTKLASNAEVKADAVSSNGAERQPTSDATTDNDLQSAEVANIMLEFSRSDPTLSESIHNQKQPKRICKVPSCTNGTVQGGLCISHGARRKKCSEPGCTKNVKTKGKCSTHGPERKKCVVDGCGKSAVQGGKCKGHGGVRRNSRGDAVANGRAQSKIDKEDSKPPATKSASLPSSSESSTSCSSSLISVSSNEGREKGQDLEKDGGKTATKRKRGDVEKRGEVESKKTKTVETEEACQDSSQKSSTISPVIEEQQVEPVGSTLVAFNTAQQQGRVPQEQTNCKMPPTKPPPVTRPYRRNKTYTTHRTTRHYVSFEEMIRLMNEYGPLMAARKRKIKDNPDESGKGRPAKVESIKRKFYRWFPDFEQRFVSNSDGTYAPRVGHLNEKSYRAAMRIVDQDMLNHKRKLGRDREARGLGA